MSVRTPFRRHALAPSLALPLAAVLVLAAVPAFAHGEGGTSGAVDLAATLGADFERTSDHVVQLAEAIPADKFGWRPAEGVRSVAEAVMHVAGANFALAGALGVAPPEGIDLENLESMTERDQVLSTLKTSIEHAKKAFEAAEGTDYNRSVNAFGFEMPAARAVVILAAHSHEHLGQLIAYARSNGVVPPWSRPSGE